MSDDASFDIESSLPLLLNLPDPMCVSLGGAESDFQLPRKKKLKRQDPQKSRN